MIQARIKTPYRNTESDKAAYDAWFETGSLNRAHQKLKTMGIKNALGKPFATSDSVRKAAIRHMINNFVESKQALIKNYKSNGYYVEDEFIDRYLIKLAVNSLLTQERIKFWLKENGLLEKYLPYVNSMIYISDD